MQVFISWSGEQTKALGHSLKEFIDTTFAGHVQSFLSDANIAPGERFNDVINDNLGSSTIGILLLTRANMTEPWILFEAGALAGKTGRGSVVPLLVDLDRGDLRPPLSQFNNVIGSVEVDLRKLCARLNAELGGKIPSGSFDLLFAEAWPKLANAIATAQTLTPENTPLPESRSAEDMLNEILLGVNALVRDARPSTALDSWPTRVTAKPRDNGDLALDKGDRLAHPEFGEGTVVAVTGEGAKRIAHVKFDVAGSKKLLIKVAPITVIGRQAPS